MGFFDLVLAGLIIVLATGIYWYTSTATCVLYGSVFTKVGSDCMLFFYVIIGGLLLVAAFFFFRFLSGGHSRSHHYPAHY